MKKIGKKFDQLMQFDGDYRPLKIQRLNSLVISNNDNSPTLLKPK